MAEIVQSGATGQSGLSVKAALNDALRRNFLRCPSTTDAAPHLRSPVNTDRLLNAFIIASLPAFLIGCWSTGSALLAAQDGAGSMRGMLALIVTRYAGTEPTWASSMAAGIAAFVPLLLTVAAVGLLWEVVFAAARNRRADAGWLPSAWLFALLTAPVPLWMAAVSYSFGVVFGKHIFGGTGRYIVSPALLASVFLAASYPLTASPLGVELAGSISWSGVATGALSPSGSGQTIGWAEMYLAGEVGSFGSPSAMACLLGAAFLCYRGAASLRIVIGAIAGAATAAIILPALGPSDSMLGLPPHWHLGLGSLAFVIAFIVTDPTTTPTTRPGRWLFGCLVGGLAVVIRELSPEHPDGALIAALLGLLCVPLIDHAMVRIVIKRLRRARGVER